ncbi:MAG TPA: sulfur carrier protein ThiS [Candidatus Brocadiia bacterium]|nr:sulfur carrier protein ThiS [Candidatus Brocadiia bacterium]
MFRAGAGRLRVGRAEWRRISGPGGKEQMRVTVNGDARDVAEGLTIRALLDLLDMPREGVAVERNREIVPKAEHSATVLKSGDELEIVTFVGGG